MSQGEVRYERRDLAVVVTFDRPDTRNAMTWKMYDQLRDACDRIDGERDVRVAVLRGAGGRAFVAGTDIRQFSEFSSGEDGLAYEARIDDVLGRLEAVSVPTVAAIEGHAVGGGLAIAAACDLRICTPDSRFGIPIARTVGNCLSMANYARLVALLGAGRTKTMLMTAAFLTADDALAAGFVTEVVERAAFEEHLQSLCATLAAHAPLTLRVTKEAVRRLMLSGLADGEDLIRACYASQDFAEGVSSFLDKRTPRWQGE